MSDPAHQLPALPVKPVRGGRAESREVMELRALRARQPDLADAADIHLELLELFRRVQGRVPLPSFEITSEILSRHGASGHALLRFEDVPLELTDLRLLVRQTADVLHRFGALEAGDHERVQRVGRNAELVAVTGRWFYSNPDRHAPAAADSPRLDDGMPGDAALDQVLILAMRPFLSRCAEVLQQHPGLTNWTRPYCALCGGEPDFAVITPAAERHLMCGRCTLHWKFEPLTCPHCLNAEQARITSFATSDGQYRVYACDVCRRYLKAYDGRRALRPVMPFLDSVATLPLDAAAMQRGYTG
ncbi:MAG: formate dehydrogenase accessory protein FdhE [Vicinamibacterales bacterium]